MLKVREHGRVVKVACMVATGINAEGFQEVLGFRARELGDQGGVAGVLPGPVRPRRERGPVDHLRCHAGLVAAAGAVFPAACWQRCRADYAANLMAVCPKAQWPAVNALLRSVYTWGTSVCPSRPWLLSRSTKPVSHGSTRTHLEVALHHSRLGFPLLVSSIPRTRTGGLGE